MNPIEDFINSIVRKAEQAPLTKFLGEGAGNILTGLGAKRMNGKDIEQNNAESEKLTNNIRSQYQTGKNLGMTGLSLPPQAPNMLDFLGGLINNGNSRQPMQPMQAEDDGIVNTAMGPMPLSSVGRGQSWSDPQTGYAQGGVQFQSPNSGAVNGSSNPLWQQQKGFTPYAPGEGPRTNFRR